MISIVRSLLLVTISAAINPRAHSDELSADSADTMSCGSNFISVGDSEDAVLTTCGEPSFREGNRWTYSDEQGSFVYELTFGAGSVLSIHTRMAD
jgi:hypothetical protein